MLRDVYLLIILVVATASACLHLMHTHECHVTGGFSEAINYECHVEPVLWGG